MKEINKLLDRASVLMKECEDILSGKAIIDSKGQIIGYKEEKEYYSICCYWNAEGEVIDNTGICAKCKDFVTFEEWE